MSYVKRMGIDILYQSDDTLIVSTDNTINAMLLIQSRGWHLDKIEEDDYFVGDIRKEKNILYYYK